MLLSQYFLEQRHVMTLEAYQGLTPRRTNFVNLGREGYNNNNNTTICKAP